MRALLKLPIHYLLVCLAAVLLASCAKEKETTPAAPPITTALSPQKATYAPFEVVVIKAPKNVLGTQALEGLINAQKVRVMTNDTLAIFIMPDIANGSHTLTFTANGKDYAMPVGVLALTNVQTPDVYFNAIEAEVNRNITAINAQADALLLNGVPTAETQALKQNAQNLANQFSTYKTTYQGFAASEKSEYARAMAANKAGDDEYEALTAVFSGRATTLRGTQTVVNYEDGVEASMKAFADETIYTVGHVLVISTLLGFLASPDPFTKAPVLVALGITVASFIIHMSLARAAAGTLLNKALKPFQNLDVDQTAYGNGMDVDVDITSQYRSLAPNDEISGTGGSILDAGLARYKQFRDAFNTLVGKLPNSQSLVPITSVLKAQFSTVARSIYNRYVRISNSSNPAVTLTQLNQANGSLKIRATTTATTSQSFSYDLTYTNTGFSPGLTKRITAQVVVVPNSLSCMTEAYLQLLTNGTFTASGSKQWHILNITSPNGSSLSYNAAVSPCKVGWTLSHPLGSTSIVIYPDSYWNGGILNVLACYGSPFNSFSFDCSGSASVISLSSTRLVMNNGGGTIFTFEPY